MARMQGVESFKRKLSRIPKELHPELRRAIQQSAEEIVASQRNLAPVRTGKLRDSIVYTFGDQNPPKYAAFKGQRADQGNPALTAIITAGNPQVRYAHLIEFGTAPHLQGGQFAGTEHPGTAAQPFFYPGYRAHRKRVKGRVSRAVTKAAKKAAGK